VPSVACNVARQGNALLSVVFLGVGPILIAENLDHRVALGKSKRGVTGQGRGQIRQA
jgi:hypothetical protein